jgi:PAS domain S-box-containing protein
VIDESHGSEAGLTMGRPMARVLVVDDNTTLAENLANILRASDLAVEVAIAPSAARALAVARERRFDVAVVDVKLPDGSGVDLIAPLRDVSPHCEILMLTGAATVDGAIAALREGAGAFLLKSFRPEELLASIAQALEKVSLRRERELYQRRYQALVEAADVLVLALDESGAVVLWNPRLAELTSDASDAALGRPFAATWVDEPDQRRFDAAVRDVLGGEGAAEVEVGMPASDGAPRRIRWHLSAVRDPDAGAESVYGIGVDVTARRALERKAASAEALNAMAPLALGLAHEIRNPLNAAVLELHLLGRAINRLDDAAARDPMRRRVDVVEGEIRRLERLLTEFLELARPRAPNREPVDLGRVAADVLELEGQAMLARGVALERALPTDVLVLGDVEKLKQVVLNIVVNALDAMAEGGALRAQVHDDPAAGEVVLAIGDSGPGVDPRILDEIFDPFFTTKPAGTGLGLALVRKIVEQHGGRVALESRPGEGTTVKVVLPRFELPEAVGRSDLAGRGAGQGPGATATRATDRPRRPGSGA